MAVYLDNNATTALDETVLEAMLPFMGQVTGNPSSVHRFGRSQKDAIEQARESVAQLVGARAEQVVFTSGGTEANNLLLNGFRRKQLRSSNPAGQIAISNIEHMSLIETAQHLIPAASNDTVDTYPVNNIRANENGQITLSALKAAVTEQTSLVSVMTANNETGVIQDLPPLIAYARECGCFFHTDASQAAGKIPLNFVDSGMHAMTVSAHKFYGPLGIGALIIDKQLPIDKILFGGSQENDFRPGTENIPAIVGFGKAAELAANNLHVRSLHMRTLRDALEEELKKISTVTIFAEQAERLPNTVQFGVCGFNGETLLMQLDRKAIAVSSGSACTSGKTEPSHVLQAMKVPDELADSAIRVSMGKNNSMSDIDTFLAALREIIETNRHSEVMLTAGAC